MHLDAVLYAEVYFICMLVLSPLLFWTARCGNTFAAELWLRRLLICFLLYFASGSLALALDFYMFDSAIFVALLRCVLKMFGSVTLASGVFCWCCYSETLSVSAVFGKRRGIWLFYLLPAAALAVPAVIFIQLLRSPGEAYIAAEDAVLRAELFFLFIVSTAYGVSLVKDAAGLLLPVRRRHMYLTAAFPLCILSALLASYVRETVPVFCVSVTMELICVSLGAAKSQSAVDKLTQLNNRQNLSCYMEHKLKGCQGDLYLLMADIDHFKAINDTYGHLAGDLALVQLAEMLKKACAIYRPRPYIARYGGDEFVIIMEGNEGEAVSICERIKELLSGINAKSQSFRLNVSIGCAKLHPGMGLKELISEADNELYKIKRAEKSRV